MFMNYSTIQSSPLRTRSGQKSCHSSSCCSLSFSYICVSTFGSLLLCLRSLSCSRGLHHGVVGLRSLLSRNLIGIRYFRRVCLLVRDCGLLARLFKKRFLEDQPKSPRSCYLMTIPFFFRAWPFFLLTLSASPTA